MYCTGRKHAIITLNFLKLVFFVCIFPKTHNYVIIIAKGWGHASGCMSTPRIY